MTVYLNSFYPLCSTRAGRNAVKNFNLPAYIDGSCRREPDFQNDFPAITSLCRPGFAKKLKQDDIVIYVTNKKGVGSRKLVAILKVFTTYKNHTDASKWYQDRKKTPPNNLMIPGSLPMALELTHKKFGWDSWLTNVRNLETWENFYQTRAKNPSEVALCEKIFYPDIPLNLDKRDWKGISTRKLCAQSPPILTEKEWVKMKEKAGI